MIEAGTFIEAARTRGFRRYVGVPCSFLTPFINYVINDETLAYLSAANEGDAVAIGAGAALGGQPAVVLMQNSGLGNAVSPLTSLTWVFRIPVLLIITHRGAPGLSDEPQHELMGSITEPMLDAMQIPWEVFPADAGDIEPALERATTWMAAERRPFAFIMKKGTVAPHALRRRSIPQREYSIAPSAAAVERSESIPPRADVLRHIAAKTSLHGDVLIATTGYTGRELHALCDQPNQLFMVGSMGCASALGLGLSLARPDLRIVIIDGDGAALMRMGIFSTIGTYGGGNLVHLILDNEAHDSTGAQATVTPNVDFARIAAACGYRETVGGTDIAMLDRLLDRRTVSSGPILGHLKIRTGTLPDLPRPKVTPEQVARRLMAHIGSKP
ncbi:MAG: phosphonopyruvate decarboxylase [Gammaproteobacteria bacterium RIFCSPLOWO2_02_FULL_61_13]|nr:MAG: phosphonopyruvate decarboxylase [Gammaproteobacteria bacterium RIFCSPLOWO2_02_FULL_61_13]